MEKAIVRAYFVTLAEEVVAVESMPLNLERADEVWFRLLRTTVIEWWRFGDTPPAVKYGARVLIKPRWDDVRPLRLGLIADRVAAMRIDAPKSQINSASPNSHPALPARLHEVFQPTVQTEGGDSEES